MEYYVQYILQSASMYIDLHMIMKVYYTVGEIMLNTFNIKHFPMQLFT